MFDDILEIYERHNGLHDIKPEVTCLHVKKIK